MRRRSRATIAGRRSCTCVRCAGPGRRQTPSERRSDQRPARTACAPGADRSRGDRRRRGGCRRRDGAGSDVGELVAGRLLRARAGTRGAVLRRHPLHDGRELERGDSTRPRSVGRDAAVCRRPPRRGLRGAAAAVSVDDRRRASRRRRARRWPSSCLAVPPVLPLPCCRLLAHLDRVCGGDPPRLTPSGRRRRSAMDPRQRPAVGRISDGLRRDVHAGQLRLGDVARAAVVQHDLRRLQFRRPVSERPGGDHRRRAVAGARRARFGMC